MKKICYLCFKLLKVETRDKKTNLERYCVVLTRFYYVLLLYIKRYD